MRVPEKQNPPTRAGFARVVSGESRHPQVSRIDAVLQRLDGVRQSGKGWRALCPACGGKSHKLAIAEGDDGRVLMTCFSCHDNNAVLAAMGMRLSDLMPFRAWPESPADKRKAWRAMREAGWAAALGVLSREATVVQIAARQLAGWGYLSQEDDDRLALAVSRIDNAREVLNG